MLQSFAVERSAFLSDGFSSDNAPLAEITRIVHDVGEGVKKHMEEATADETAAKENFKELVPPMEREISVLQQRIEDKMMSTGQVGIDVAESGGSLDNLKETLADDGKYLESGDDMASSHDDTGRTDTDTESNDVPWGVMEIVSDDSTTASSGTSIASSIQRDLLAFAAAARAAADSARARERAVSSTNGGASG